MGDFGAGGMWPLLLAVEVTCSDAAGGGGRCSARLAAGFEPDGTCAGGAGLGGGASRGSSCWARCGTLGRTGGSTAQEGALQQARGQTEGQESWVGTG